MNDSNKPLAPIAIVRTLDNCYPGSRGVLDSITDVLNPRLAVELLPAQYGRDALRQIVINTAMSFYDDYHCKTNYVIADETLKLRRCEYHDLLRNAFEEHVIEREGLFLRPRYQIGPLNSRTGLIYVTIVFEKAFSFLPEREQKQVMSGYFLTAVERIARRKKKLDYDFPRLICDFKRVLDWWIDV
ncbi:MAG: hypothetical protein K2L99_04940 [Muribaculaceae bacterium]|nr:hypothetical protein [Muribaculaceae bacterium]